MKKIIIIIFLLLVFSFLYFMFNPIFQEFDRYIHPRKLGDISHVKNYYSILSSFFITIVSFMGLLLGYFYYQNNLNYDENRIKTERSRVLFEYLLKELSNFDDLVHLIISAEIQNELELINKRNKINRSFENIVIMLEEHNDFYNFSQDDIKVILEVNSFVEQCETIMQDDISKITVDSMSNIKDEYINLIQNAKRICHERLK